MRNRMKGMALMTAMMAAAAGSDDLFGRPRREPAKQRTPTPRAKQPARQLREFTIKGEKVMAYSKKDAVIRLKHQKK